MGAEGNEGKDKNSIIDRFRYASAGIVTAVKTERNIRLHLFFMTLVIVAGFIFKISKMEWVACIILFAAVIAGEMINTAIEAVIDELIPYKNDKAKLAKDLAAGAVLILAIAAAIIGLIIFIPKLI